MNRIAGLLVSATVAGLAFAPGCKGDDDDKGSNGGSSAASAAAGKGQSGGKGGSTGGSAGKAGSSGGAAGDTGTSGNTETYCPGATLVTDKIQGGNVRGTHAFGLTLDGDNLYWVESGVDGRGRVMKVSIDGGDPGELFSVDENVSGDFHTAMIARTEHAPDAKNLFVKTRVTSADKKSCDLAYSIAKDGSSATAIWTRPGCDDGPFAFPNGATPWATDGTRVYFDCIVSGGSPWGTGYGTGGLCSLSGDGSDFQYLLSTDGPGIPKGVLWTDQATVVDGIIYWAEGGGPGLSSGHLAYDWYKMPASGLSAGDTIASLVTLPAGDKDGDIANDDFVLGDNWPGGPAVGADALFYRGGPNGSAIFQLPLDGGTPQILVPGTAASGSNRYQALSDGELYFVVRRDGADCKGVSTGPDGCHYLAKIAADGSDNGQLTLVGGAWTARSYDDVFVNDSGLFILISGDGSTATPDRIIRCPKDP